MLSGTLKSVRKPRAADAADCHAARSSRSEPCRRRARKMEVPGAPTAILASTSARPDYAHPWDMAASSSSQSQVPSANYLRPVESQKAITPPLKDVAAVQRRLIELGYFVGTADGVWGARSRASLRAFKAANSLGADEEWDEMTSARLFSSRAARAPMPISSAAR
jgi:Putative peptidoglycan binding domain